uniref:Putative ovule protein n=1 Tax=Solanum chacoense TaxID=4108 RepID=A0A0V0GXL4_SOLCH
MKKQSSHTSIKSFMMGLCFSMLACLRQLLTACLTVSLAFCISSAENLCSTMPSGPGCSTLTTVSTSSSSCLKNLEKGNTLPSFDSDTVIFLLPIRINFP